MVYRNGEKNKKFFPSSKNVFCTETGQALYSVWEFLVWEFLRVTGHRDDKMSKSSFFFSLSLLITRAYEMYNSHICNKRSERDSYGRIGAPNDGV